ncbi:MAG: EamA family transporter [Rhodopseudomonas sp.]|nr:EamA family transporter [Rhodopseudomonas sp.]
MPHAQTNNSAHKASVAGTAKLLVLVLAFAWGLNWIAAALALPEVSPWSLRFAGAGIGAATLFAAAFLTGHSLKVPRGEHIHIMIAGFFNVAAFQILSAFAQLSGQTSRAIIITYSMPIWATVLGRIILGEKLGGIRLIAFALCVTGLSILIWPLFANGLPPTVFLSFGCAFSWAFATVYMKWMKTTVEPLANAAWQLLFGFLFIAAGTFIVDGGPKLWPLSTEALLAVLYVGIFGVGLAHFLWWSIVGRLPTVTASIGALLVPVVGVVASVIVLGERPTTPDIVGFVLIFFAAACVLLQPNVKHSEMPE